MNKAKCSFIVTSSLMVAACGDGYAEDAELAQTDAAREKLTLAASALNGAIVNQQLDSNDSIADITLDKPGVAPIFRPPPFFTTIPTLAAPTGLKRTLDANECAAHFPAPFAQLFCQASIANGDVMLVWNWNANTCIEAPCITNIQGYRLWRSDYKKPVEVIDTQTTSPSHTARGVRQPPQGTRTCYVVTAFLGDYESPPSEPFCFLNLAPQSKFQTFEPNQVATFVRSASKNWQPPGGTGNGPPPPLTELSIGFMGDSGITAIDDPPFFDSYWYWYAWRSAVSFNLANVTFKTIERATLNIRSLRAIGSCDTLGLDSAEDFMLSVAAADESWGPGFQSLGGAPFPAERAFAGQFTLRQFHERGNLAELDVTHIVREWAQKPATNRGFLLRGPSEQSTEESNCVIAASGFGLDVVFQEPSWQLQTPRGMFQQ